MKILKIILILSLALLIPGCSDAITPVTESTFALDTLITVTLYAEDEAAFEAIFSLVDDFEEMLSRHIVGSEVDLINRQAGIPTTVSGELILLIDDALSYSRLSDGLFDITIGPLVDLWDIGGEEPEKTPPDPGDITRSLGRIDYRRIQTGPETVTLAQGQSIDLGGIAKGFIADEIIHLLKERGIQRAILNLGGNVYVHGTGIGGGDFSIGIQNPDAGRGDYLAIVHLSDRSVVTSGLYERYFIHENRLYHHILDPRTGYPTDNSLKSVSIISTSSKDGDALSTTLFLLGLDAGYELALSLDEIEAIFVTKDNEVIITPGLTDRFELTDPTYHLKEMRP